MSETILYILGRMHGLTVQEIRQVKTEKTDDWGTTPVTLEGWAVVEDDIREFARHKWETAPPPEPEPEPEEEPQPPVGEVPPEVVFDPLAP